MSTSLTVEEASRRAGLRRNLLGLLARAGVPLGMDWRGGCWNVRAEALETWPVAELRALELLTQHRPQHACLEICVAPWTWVELTSQGRRPWPDATLRAAREAWRRERPIRLRADATRRGSGYLLTVDLEPLRAALEDHHAAR